MLYLKKMLQSMRIIGLLKDLISNWKLSIGPIFNNTLLATKLLQLSQILSSYK